jgi:hypothetical protein
MDDIKWSQRLGVLIADALVDAKIISKSELSRAADIAAEEILVRLSMKDRPSPAAGGSQKDED